MSKRTSRATSQASSPLDTTDVDGRSKRRRTKATRFDFQFLENEEQRLLQQVFEKIYLYVFLQGCFVHCWPSCNPQALKISKLETKRENIPIQEAPTYYPTIEEFADCMKYIKRSVFPLLEY